MLKIHALAFLFMDRVMPRWQFSACVEAVCSNLEVFTLMCWVGSGSCAAISPNVGVSHGHCAEAFTAMFADMAAEDHWPATHAVPVPDRLQGAPGSWYAKKTACGSLCLHGQLCHSSDHRS